MKCEVKYSRVAVRDLERVWADVYEASKSVDIAERYIEELLDKIEGRADSPESGSPLYYENGFTGYRFIVFKAYMVFYRFKGNVLFVDRILLAKSDYINVLHLI